MKKIRNSLQFFVLFFLTLLSIDFSVATDDLPPKLAIECLKRLNRQYAEDPKSDLAETVNAFVRTGKYEGPLGHFSKLNYKRLASDDEKGIMFEALIRTALQFSNDDPKDGGSFTQNDKVLTGYERSLNNLYCVSRENRHYDQDYRHQLTAYVASLLATLEWSINEDERWDYLEYRVIYEVVGLQEQKFDLRKVIRKTYADPLFREAFKSVTKREIKRVVPSQQEQTLHWMQLVKKSQPNEQITHKKARPVDQCNEVPLVFFGEKPLAKFQEYRRGPGLIPYVDRTYLVWALSRELGLEDHLAKTFHTHDLGSFGGRKTYEEFARLFDTKDEEGKGENEDQVKLLKKARAKYGDLSVLKLATHSQDRYMNTLNKVHPDSMDLLFLHHILLGPSDSATRNFLFQYRDSQLHLVRIDYGDGFINTNRFLGEGTQALFEKFGAKGMGILKRLSSETLKKAFWLKYAGDHPYDAVEKWKHSIAQRMRIIDIMLQKGFFERNSRGETMAALYYVGLRWILTQKAEESSNYFVDNYFAKYYPEHPERGNNDACRLASLSEIFGALIRQHDEKIEEANGYASTLPALKEIDKAFAEQVIDDWLRHDNKFDLPVVKEHLDSHPALKERLTKH